MIPKGLAVVRLFENEKIKCNLTEEILKGEWKSIKDFLPTSRGVYLLKNESSIFKGIYLSNYPILHVPRWWDTLKDEYIDVSDITHWMALPD